MHKYNGNKSERIERKMQNYIQRASMSERNSQCSRNSKGSVIRLSNQEVQDIKMERNSNKKSDKKSNNLIINQLQYIQYKIAPEILKKQECLICQTQNSVDSFVEFGTCGHKFCLMCINQYIRFKLLNFQQIFCPLDGCNCKIQKNHSLYMNLAESQKEKYQKILLHFQILSNPSLRRCKSQNCNGKIQIKSSLEKQKEKTKEKLQCVECKKLYCPLCLEYYHEDKCESDMIKFLQKNKRFRQCKSCKMVVEKSQGCAHITCICGFYFCYQCGQELIGNHVCKIPIHLNCLQLIRWDIQHKELFYQSNRLSFHNYLVCIQLQTDKNAFLRILYSLLYVISVYPLTIAFSILIILMFFSFVLCFAMVAFLILPVIQICGNPQFKITSAINDCCGCFPLAIMIIMFYPIFVILLIMQAIGQLCKNDTANDIREIFSQIGIGLRNIIMMPFILCISSQDIEEPPHTMLQASKMQEYNY